MRTTSNERLITRHSRAAQLGRSNLRPLWGRSGGGGAGISAQCHCIRRSNRAKPLRAMAIASGCGSIETSDLARPNAARGRLLLGLLSRRRWEVCLSADLTHWTDVIENNDRPRQQ